MAERAPIPEPVKREVRQRCCFGCVICGLPLCEYDHLVPYAEVRTHDPTNLVLLCDQHHREKTGGLLPAEAVAAAMESPSNCTRGLSHPYQLHYAGEGCEARLGSLHYRWSPFPDEMIASPIIIDDVPLVAFHKEGGHLLLTVQLFDRANRLILQVLDNELVYSVTPWDIDFVGQTLTMRGAARDVLIRMTLEPPTNFILDRAHVHRNGIEVDVRSEVIILPGNDRLHLWMDQCPIGLALGDVPVRDGIAFSMPNIPRADYEADPDTERRLRRIRAAV
jgi:hypothetical protein